MARREPRPQAIHSVRLETQRRTCLICGGPLWVAYHSQRRVLTLDGLTQLTMVVRSCCTTSCDWYRHPYHPEEEGHWVLPQGEIGLDVIALIGWLRYGEHRSIPEIYQQMQAREVQMCESTVLHLVQRYEELVSIHVNQSEGVKACLKRQGAVILAVDGLQPDIGHEILWVIRDVLSGQILLARSLLSSTQENLTALLSEEKQRLSVPVLALVSDGHPSICQAVAKTFPEVPHQLCHFHSPQRSG